MTGFTAKVRLSSKINGGEAVQLNFMPDYEQGRNAEWAVATPSMMLNMHVKRELADRIEVGTNYTLIFDPDRSEIDNT